MAASLQPADIITPSPIDYAEGVVDSSNVIDWDSYFNAPILFTIYDTSNVIDWQTYFDAPILYLNPIITQAHGLTALDLEAANANVAPTSLTEDVPLLSSDITTGASVLGSTDLQQDYIFSGSSLLLGAFVGSSAITQVHDLSVVAILLGQPVVSSTGLISNTSFQANDLIFPPPQVATANITEDESLSPQGLLSGSPELSSTSLSQTHNLAAEDKLVPNPELGRPVDPRESLQEIEELKQMFGGWPRRNYEVPDGRLVQAEREIERQFGQKVSVDRKAKSLIKFGKSAALATGSLQTVWTVGGNETYVSGNTIDSISSSSALDNQEIYLECHTVDENGDFTFLSQVVTLNGQNRVPLPTPVARVSLAYNNNGTNLAGRVVVYENTTLNAGIPTDVTKIHIDIPQGLQESFKAATTFSSTDYFILTGGFGSVSLKQDGAADFYLEIREPGKVFRQVAAVSAASASPWSINLDPAVIIPKNYDVRVRVETSTNNVVVFTVFQGYLAKIL